MAFFAQIRLTLVSLVCCLGTSLWAFDEVRSTNLSTEEALSTREMGLAGAYLALPHGDGTTLLHPAGLASAKYYSLELTHAEPFGLATWDDLRIVMPYRERATMAFEIARYSPGELDRHNDGDAIADGTFGASDYLIMSAFERGIGPVELGVNLSLLYRQLDQVGVGFRGDVSAMYSSEYNYTVSALIKGALPSSASWTDDGYTEYSPPDVYIGLSYLKDAPYFYGQFLLGYQTPGLLQKQAHSAQALEGERVIQNPDQLLYGPIAVEYLSHWGLSLRMGLPEWAEVPLFPTFGLGYRYKSLFSIEYALSDHQDLGATHRISLRFFSGFSAFNKRRPGISEEIPPSGEDLNEDIE